MFLTGSDPLSSVLGWISIASWIVVYSPQIYENYVLQSGEGVSVLFVLIWLLGDIFNLAGAVLAGLIPTIIILGFYYSACDLILLCQIYYYRWKRGSGDPEGFRRSEERHEQTPLIAGEVRATTAATPIQVVILRYTCAAIFVVAVGVGAWWLNEADEKGTQGQAAAGPQNSWLVQFFGWSSALLFLGARIPQILKNFKTRCEGLSPALFFFSILGNTTYAWSICAKSTERSYLLTNAGWLAGSGLTVFLDVFVLCQFMYYGGTEDGRDGEVVI